MHSNNAKPSGLVFMFVLCLLFLCDTAFSENKPETVNILSWWGYLNGPWIKQAVKEQCNAELSFDEYFSNTEFLHRWREKKNPYDVVIFSDTVFDVVKNEILLKQSGLYKNTTGYNPYIRAQYLKRKYPPNVVYFSHALTGFLWNQENISLNTGDTILSIFKKAGDNFVVLMDDPVEVNLLVNRGLGKKEHDINIQNIKNITQKSVVYITNDYKTIYRNHGFSIAYLWSGEAVGLSVNTNNQYKFLVHPKLSYISSDLLSVLNNRTASVCVSALLSSKMFLTKLHNEVLYFSPYTDLSQSKNPIYSDLYKKFTSNLKTLPWISPASEDELKLLDQEWVKIQLEFVRARSKQPARTQKLH